MPNGTDPIDYSSWASDFENAPISEPDAPSLASGFDLDALASSFESAPTKESSAAGFDLDSLASSFEKAPVRRTKEERLLEADKRDKAIEERINFEKREKAAHEASQEGFLGRQLWSPVKRAGSSLLSIGSRAVGAGETADEANRYSEYLGEVSSQSADRHSLYPALSRAGGGAVQSLLTAVPATMVGGVPGAIGAATVEQGNQAITEGRDAGLTGGELFTHVAGQAALEGGVAGLFSKFGFGGVENALDDAIKAGLKEGARSAAKQTAKEALAKTAKELGAEMSEELITAFGQRYASQLSGVSEELGAEEAGDIAEQTALQTIVTLGLVKAPGAISSTTDRKTAPGEVAAEITIPTPDEYAALDKAFENAPIAEEAVARETPEPDADSTPPLDPVITESADPGPTPLINDTGYIGEDVRLPESGAVASPVDLDQMEAAFTEAPVSEEVDQAVLEDDAPIPIVSDAPDSAEALSPVEPPVETVVDEPSISPQEESVETTESAPVAETQETQAEQKGPVSAVRRFNNLVEGYIEGGATRPDAIKLARYDLDLESKRNGRSNARTEADQIIREIGDDSAGGTAIDEAEASANISRGARFGQSTTRQPNPVIVEGPGGQKPIDSRSVFRGIQKAFGVANKTRAGRFAKRIVKAADAFFSEFSGNIRFREADARQFLLLAHEVAHDIHTKRGGLDVVSDSAPNDIPAEFDYAPKRRNNQLSREERFAGWFSQSYLVNPDEARELAPKFAAYFENWLAKNPADAKAVKLAQRGISDYYNQSYDAFERSQFSNTGLPSSIYGETLIGKIGESAKEAFQRIHYNWFNRLQKTAEFSRAVEDSAARSGVPLPPGETIMDIQRSNIMMESADAQKAFTDGVHNPITGEYKLGRDGKKISYYDILRPITEGGENTAEQFGVYAGARSAKEQWNNTEKTVEIVDGKEVITETPAPIDPGMPLEAAEAILKRYEDNALFAETAEKLTEFFNAIRAVQVDIGQLSQARYDAMVGKWTHYLPNLAVDESRIWSRLPRWMGGSGKPGATGTKGDAAVRSRKGSAAQRLNPLLSTYVVVPTIYRSMRDFQVFDAYAKAAERYPGLGQYIERVDLDPAVNEESVFRELDALANQVIGKGGEKIHAPSASAVKRNPDVLKSYFEEVQSVLGEAGADISLLNEAISLSKSDPQAALDALSVAYPMGFTDGKNDYVISFHDANGVRRYQVDPQLYEEIVGSPLPPELMWLNTVKKLTEFQKLWITGANLGFSAVDFFRNFQGYLFQREFKKGLEDKIIDAIKGVPKEERASWSDVRKTYTDPPVFMGRYLWTKMVPAFQGWLRGAGLGKVADKIKGDRVVQALIDQGLETGMFIEANVGSGRRQFAKNTGDTSFREKGDIAAMVIDGLSAGLELVRNVVQAGDAAVRFPEALAAIEKYGYTAADLAEGRVPANIMRVAKLGARNVGVDFTRRGRKMDKYLSKINPYAPAALAAQSQIVETIKRDPVKFASRALLYGVLPAAAYWLAYRDNDHRKESARWLDRYWVFYDSDGNPTTRIPKAQGYHDVIAGATIALLDGASGIDPDAGTRLAKNIVDSFNPPIYPRDYTGVGDLIALATNERSFPRGAPIVPGSLKDLPPELQYNERTPEIYKAIGQVTGVSPMKLQYVAESATGGLAKNLVEPSRFLPMGRFTFAGEYGESQTLFDDAFKKADENYKAAKKLRREEIIERLKAINPDVNWRVNEEVVNIPNSDLDRAVVDDYAYTGAIRSLMTDIRLSAAHIKNDPKAKFENSEKYLIGLARAATGQKALDRYPNPLSIPGSELPDAVRAVRDDWLGGYLYTLTNTPTESLVSNPDRLIRLDQALRITSLAEKLPRADLIRMLVERAVEGGSTDIGAISERANRIPQ